MHAYHPMQAAPISVGGEVNGTALADHDEETGMGGD
jgi:hypothetical protein